MGKEAASIFADDGKLMELSADEIREASERTSACEKEANTMLMEVRKFVTARQIEAKGKDASVEVSTELIKFQTRLSTAQGEIGKQRKLFTSVEQRISVKRVLDDADKRLIETEDKVEQAMTAITGIMDTSKDISKEESDKLVKNAEVVVREAQISVRTTVRYLEQQSRGQGKTKEAIAKLDPRMQECQNKITQADAAIKEHGERMFTKGILQEAEQKVADCEAALRKAEEAEAPFTQDGASVSASGIQELEKAIQVAQSTASGCVTFISMKRLAVKRLSEASNASCNDFLTKLQGTVEANAKKIADLRGRATELKRTALRAQAKSSFKPAPKNVS